ncbi:2'-5' RNA ligase family protein [Legionella hackeliae]|uniref:Uncharacterized protein n=1 Tax=Legionella hackeliae TaxID=449 RepID=A0A0A8UT24_LEGHA|nr:DUF1045 domain-containing protein [Legionella hackeliae]KTD12594.1 hypothetical protein Lhac_1465 [Legionella hackeliae]CEK12010.1 conserved exported protein of unknown function [Legionella hackeliae]STX48793.1 Protein of uncharacterised function (DUF1045) [Legionella hackeliae]
MGYRISHHSKKILHTTLFFNLYLSLLLWSSAQIFAAQTHSESVNIYLKFAPDNAALELIQKFNAYLCEKNIFSQYRFTPFLAKHPVHVTLYLTNYDSRYVTRLRQQIQDIARKTKPVRMQTKTIEMSSGMYTMLFIANNKHLQELSNQVVLHLMKYRDKRTPLPSWVHDNDKKLSFLRFGSPNVFENFSPHMSIFAVNHLTTTDMTRLRTSLTPLINNFNKSQQRVTIRAIAIGIGLADAQGQIVKELYSFPLDG